MNEQLIIREVEAKTVLNQSRIPGVNIVINPYTGCQHGCSYCYAKFMARYSGYHPQMWGQFVDIKINASCVLENQLKKKRKGPRSKVLLSSVTDAYQPIESQYKITQRCLELLHEYHYPVSILTKSNLVSRDIDILSLNGDNEVGFTVISLDKRVSQVFEGGAPVARRRLDAMNTLSEAGIKTYAFVGPMFPLLSTDTLPNLISEIAEAGAEYAMFDRLNIKSGIGPTIDSQVRANFPEQAATIMNFLKQESGFYSELRGTIEDLCSEAGVGADIIY